MHYTQTLLYRGISFIAAFAYRMNLRVQRHLAIVYIQHIGGWSLISQPQQKKSKCPEFWQSYL